MVGWDGSMHFSCPMCIRSLNHTFSEMNNTNFSDFQIYRLGLCRYHYKMIFRRALVQFKDISLLGFKKAVESFESDILYAREL